MISTEASLAYITCDMVPPTLHMYHAVIILPLMQSIHTQIEIISKYISYTASHTKYYLDVFLIAIIQLLKQ